MNSDRRLYELDVLRGLAALGVVLFHYTRELNNDNPYWFKFLSGYYGVELFFMISGFVIFMTLEKVNNGLDFIISRFSRLYPSYWMSIFIIAILTFIFSSLNQHYTLAEIFVNLTMLQAFLKVQHLNDSYWTLTHELIFYVIMFSFYKLKILDKIDKISFIWLGLIAFIAIVNKYDLFSFSGKISVLVLADHGMFFIAGIAFYQIYKKGVNLPYSIIIGLSLLTYFLRRTHGYNEVIAFFLIFLAVITGKMKFINLKPLIFLGIISYSLYLNHGIIGELVIPYLNRDLGLNINLAIFICVSLSIAISSLITFYIEKPAMSAIKAKGYELFKR